MEDGGRNAAAAIALFALLALLLVPPFTAGCGQGRVLLEDLTGMTRLEAEEALAQAGLEAGDTVSEFSDTVAEGAVVSTSPPGGEELARGTRVALVVSKGPDLVEVPGLLGLRLEDAVSLLKDRGLGYGVGEAYDETVEEGLVCGQDPDGGGRLKRGSGVVLTVSRGSAWTACSSCGGSGRVTQSSPCPECGGSGLCFT